jgi:hypothetical protein
MSHLRLVECERDVTLSLGSPKCCGNPQRVNAASRFTRKSCAPAAAKGIDVMIGAEWEL